MKIRRNVSGKRSFIRISENVTHAQSMENNVKNREKTRQNRSSCICGLNCQFFTVSRVHRLNWRRRFLQCIQQFHTNLPTLAYYALSLSGFHTDDQMEKRRQCIPREAWNLQILDAESLENSAYQIGNGTRYILDESLRPWHGKSACNEFQDLAAVVNLFYRTILESFLSPWHSVPCKYIK